MENIVNTNNTNLRLCELRVGLFNTLRVSLPMVSPDATDVQVLLTNGTITTAYSATKNTDGVWICDVDAAQFSSFGKQKYEVAYKLDNKQFWDGQGWVNVVPATTSGIVPQPVQPPHRWAIISITQGDITHYADENGDINLDDITRVRWDNVIDKPDFADVATSGSYNNLEDVPTTFPPEAHTHTKSEITNFPTSMPPTAHSHASDNWFTTEINSKADEAKPSFSTITINGVDYTEWTLGTRSGKIVLSVDMGGISTEIAAFNPVTGVFESAPSQYRNTLRFDGEAPVVGASPTLFDHVARESALSGKADISHTHTKSEITDFPVPVIPSTEADDSEFASAKKVAEFVNSSINNLAAYYLTYNAQGDAFPTKTALDAATTFYNGGVARSPTKNDYLIVLADEEHTTALGVNPTTRYVYDGAQWAFQYVVNNTSLTQAQVDAINSGITALLVNWLAAFKGSDTSTTLASVLSELSNKLSLTDGDLLISGGHIEVNDTIYANGAIYKVGGRELGFNIDSGRSGNIAVDADFSPTNPAPYVSALFNDSNTYLTGVIDARLPYPIYAAPSTGLLKDRAINTTSLASVTVPNDFTDLLIRASVASSLAVTMPDGITTKYGDTFPAAAGEYLITITKTGAAEAYVRTIKMEVANA